MVEWYSLEEQKCFPLWGTIRAQLHNHLIVEKMGYCRILIVKIHKEYIFIKINYSQKPMGRLFWATVISILLIVAIIIINSNQIDISESEGKKQFAMEYSKWLFKTSNNLKIQ